MRHSAFYITRRMLPGTIEARVRILGIWKFLCKRSDGLFTTIFNAFSVPFSQFCI